VGDYDDMKDRIKEGNGVAVTTLRELREAINIARLGPYVLQQVSDKLHRAGIDYFPRAVIDTNPAPRQDQEVRLVLQDQSSPIYKALSAIDKPDRDGDAFLVGLATQSPAAEVARLEDQILRAKGALADAQAALDENNGS